MAALRGTTLLRILESKFGKVKRQPGIASGSLVAPVMNKTKTVLQVCVLLRELARTNECYKVIYYYNST